MAVSYQVCLGEGRLSAAIGDARRQPALHVGTSLERGEP
jgi:hypothetical protein